MKKAILFIFVMIGFYGQAQDPEIFKTKFDSIGAIEFAKSIVNDTKDKFTLFHVSRVGFKNLNVIFKLDGITDDDAMLDIKTNGLGCDKCLILVFYKTYDKYIPELDVAENPHYLFKKTNKTEFLNLYPIWGKYFYPKATAEEVVTSYSLRKYIKIGLSAYLTGDDKEWHLNIEQ